MRIRRSRTRGLQEKLKKLLGYRAFRCLEEDCEWRELIKVKPLGNDIFRKNMVQILFVITIIITIYLTLFLINTFLPGLFS